MDVYRIYSFAFSKLRPRRLNLFFNLLEIGGDTTVLDLGGSLYFWKLAAELGLPLPRVTIVNISLASREDLPQDFTWLAADARALPFADRSFDAVFCNSVIEHVGGRDDQRRCAAEIIRVGKSYFVQTPDRSFPVEPHVLMPFVHWLPDRMRRRLVPDFTVRGMFFRLTDAEKEDLRNVWLLGRGEFQDLFPHATIGCERLLGLSKSLFAVSRCRE